ncbi:hypothetical protein H310_12125 [Aphanomyces invadans]|uniref:Uncharacterized protein n=1 Tax=Aphanomyces invadans TaxID=157072 RepID=A0A024TJD8_9STRA|nr:hypothetical protein H310_12125 [Aphanomyces invadans]ETV94109.1 hypothetical protein H310_12125 [Aphanomyces invadans]|eukprot:XP_008877313.1 hypothetical protein H310_12125 [Aphanomyces invadans]
MDPQVYEQVLLAVDVCHAGSSAQSDRNAAYMYCETFQERLDCIQYAFYLLQDPSRPFHHRHFALHVVETWVRKHWKACSGTDDAVNYRANVLTIMASHLNADEPTFLKEKLVKVVSDIAKRSFPQRWPDMLDHLMQIWSVGPLQTELVMLIFRSIAEDCVSSTFNSTIPPTRRKDLLQGLNASFPALFPCVYRELEAQYTRLHQQGAHAAAVMLAGLQMMKEFLDWMPVTTPAAPDANFISVAGLLLHPNLDTPQLLSLQIAAAECLEEYFSRSFGKENMALLHQASLTCWSHMAAMSLSGPVDDNDTLLLHTHINRILVSWGSHQLDEFLADDTSLPTQFTVLQNYLGLLQTLFRHPSMLITESQVIVWLNVLKHQSFKKVAQFVDLNLLWTTCLDKYFKLNSPDRDDASPTSLLEFDDHDAYNAFYGNFRGRLYGILRLLVQKEPAVALTHLHDRLQYVLTAHAAGRDHLDDLGHCTDATTAHLYHEGMSSLLDCLVKSLPDSVYETPALLRHLGQSVELLLAYQTTDPWLLFRHCLCLSSFSKYYMKQVDPPMYPRVFDRLFGLIVFCEPGESIHGTMRPTSTNVRRRALASLISICNTGPLHVLPYLPVLCTQVLALFPQVLDSESVLMYEMLVVVSNSMATFDERHAFIQEITAAPLAQWTSPEMTAVASSEDALVKALEQNDATVIFGLLKVLTTLYGIAKRITSLASNQPTDKTAPLHHPFASVWPVLLPNLTALVRTLHGLSTPLARQTLEQTTTSARGILSMSLEEINQALLGKEQVDVVDSVLMKYARWAKNTRDICYHLLGCAFGHASVFATMDVPSLMQSSVLTNLVYLEHRHWKTFLSSVWLPFVKSCPPSLYESLLQPTVWHVLSHLADRLHTGYSKTAATDPLLPRFAGVNIQSTTIDTVAHAVFVEVVRYTVDFIEAMIDAKTVVDVESAHPKHVVVESDRILREFIVSSDGITRQLVQVLVGILGYSDTLSCRRATGLLDRLVSVLFAQPQYHTLFGKDVFTSALVVLLAHFHDVDDGLKWEVINLLRNIYCRLTLGLLPVEECKGFDPLHQPVKPDSDLCFAPRAILASLHGVQPHEIAALEASLRSHHSVKTQKNFVKEFLESPFLAYVDAPHTFKAIDDLPEALASHRRPAHPTTSDVDVSGLFGAHRE